MVSALVHVPFKLSPFVAHLNLGELFLLPHQSMRKTRLRSFPLVEKIYCHCAQQAFPYFLRRTFVLLIRLLLNKQRTQLTTFGLGSEKTQKSQISSKTSAQSQDKLCGEWIFSNSEWNAPEALWTRLSVPISGLRALVLPWSEWPSSWRPRKYQAKDRPPPLGKTFRTRPGPVINQLETNHITHFSSTVHQVPQLQSCCSPHGSQKVWPFLPTRESTEWKQQQLTVVSPGCEQTQCTFICDEAGVIYRVVRVFYDCHGVL